MKVDGEQLNINKTKAYVNSILTKPNEERRKQQVCTYWLKSACRLGKQCPFLHSYDPDKIPICKYYKENGHCNQEGQGCVYRHPPPDTTGGAGRQQTCPYYERGFCKNNACPFIHNAESNWRLCINYLLGFCPDGPKC